jgi:hypothetical protein
VKNAQIERQHQHHEEDERQIKPVIFGKRKIDRHFRKSPFFVLFAKGKPFAKLNFLAAKGLDNFTGAPDRSQSSNRYDELRQPILTGYLLPF